MAFVLIVPKLLRQCVSPGAGPEPGVGGRGLLILNRADVEVYGPKSKKRVLYRHFFIIYMLSEAISYNYFESTPKKRRCP